MKHNDAVFLQLEHGLKTLQLNAYSEPLFDYLTLLCKWNKAYNLTAIRDRESMVGKHLLDSLAIAPWVSGTRIIDVGTGAGLPGIPLAITHPDKQFVLLDSNGKKMRFLTEVKRVLSLNNVEIVQSRVEDYQPEHGFDTVISRAFSSLEQMLHWTQHLVAKEGIWLAMKGRYPEEELAVLHHNYRVEEYSVEHVEGERCCVLINNTHKE